MPMAACARSACCTAPRAPISGASRPRADAAPLPVEAPMRPLSFLLACLLPLALPTHSRANEADPRRQIGNVIDAFRTSIIAKDKARFVELFLHENIPWQDVTSEPELQRMRRQRPDARKVAFDPKDTWRAFIDDIVADTERTEE